MFSLPAAVPERSLFQRLARSLVLVCAAAVTGCDARTPLQLDPDMAAAGVARIALVPVVDSRPDRFDYVVIGRDVADATVRFVRSKGYLIAQSDGYGKAPIGPLDIDVDTVDAAALLPLAPEKGRFFLVVQIEKLDRRLDDEGASYYVRLSGVLVDRETGRILWRDVGSATNSFSGLLTVLAGGTMQYDAAVNATRDLLQTLPARADEDAEPKR